MRTVAVALCFSLVMAAAIADEPDPSEVLREIQPKRDLWLKCTAGVAKSYLGGKRDPASIADAALSRCRSQESTLRDALRRRVGKASSDHILELVRETDRLSLIRVIEMLRAN